MQNSLEKTWQIYTTSWKATSEAERRKLFEQALEPACRYLDPLGSVSGFDALSANIAAFQQQLPGTHFETTQFWSHDNKCLARWEMRGASGAVLGQGASYAEFSATGRLSVITGFFDVPSE